MDDAVTMKHVPVTADGKLATPDGPGAGHALSLDGRAPPAGCTAGASRWHSCCVRRSAVVAGGICWPLSSPGARIVRLLVPQRLLLFLLLLDLRLMVSHGAPGNPAQHRVVPGKMSDTGTDSRTGQASG